MLDAEMEVITVLEVQGSVATVELPDTSLEQWSLAALPEGALPGDRVGVTMIEGDLSVTLLPRPPALRA